MHADFILNRQAADNRQPAWKNRIITADTGSNRVLSMYNWKVPCFCLLLQNNMTFWSASTVSLEWNFFLQA